MSQENVEMVLRLLPAPDVDLVVRVRDDDMWAAFSDAVAAFVHPDFEYVVRGIADEKTTYVGVDGLRDAWLDWFAPWVSYRTEIDKAVDLGGDRVLLLFHDFGRSRDSSEEVTFPSANIWTVRDGQIARIEVYAEHDHALKAVGLKA
jgi:ketosteroid isomerase-like protein